MRKLLIIGGVPVDDITMRGALDRLEHFITIGRATGTTHQIATVNADFVVNALHDPELRYILQSCDMATADGTPLVLGARLLGVPLTGRVTGADMVPALAERAAQRGYSFYLLGAKPGVAAQAGAVLQQRYPGLNIVGIESPPNVPITETDQAILDHIRAAKPDVLLVAFGNPKQEKWIHMHARDLRVPVCIGVGGTFDMLAGFTRRAPLWMQRAGLEWLFRLVQEPGRLWKRYVRDMFYFGRFFAQQWWAMRQEPPTMPQVQAVPDAAASFDEHAMMLDVRGRLDRTSLAVFVEQAEHALDARPFLIVNLTEATFLDSSALGSLVALTNRARAEGGALALAAVPPSIERILSLIHLDHFFDTFGSVAAARDYQQTASLPATEQPQEPGEWTLLKLPRTLDTNNVPSLLERWSALLAQHPKLVLDFSETVFLAGAGLTALMKLSYQSREHGGEVRVAGCSHEVAHVIKLVRLDRFVSLYENVADAMDEHASITSSI